MASQRPPSNPNVHQESVLHAHDAFGAGEFDDEVEEDASLQERVMAVDLRERGTIGCCYYVAATEGLYLLEDVKSGGLDTIDLRKYILRYITERCLIKDSQATYRAHGNTHLSQHRRKC